MPECQNTRTPENKVRVIERVREEKGRRIKQISKDQGNMIFEGKQRRKRIVS